MKRLLVAAFAALLAISCPASSQENKSSMGADISASFPTNNQNSISASSTRAFLNRLINSYQQAPQVNAPIGTSYTFAASDYGKLVILSNASPVAVTLPQATGSFAVWNAYVSNIGAGTVTITPQGGSLIGGLSSLSVTTGQNYLIVSDGTNYQIASSAIGIGTVSNSNLASMAGGTVKCRPFGATSGPPFDCNYPTINVTDPGYGAAANALSFTDGAITGGTVAFSSSSATFTSGDVGKTIIIQGAGAAGATFVTTIAAFTNAHAVNLTASATTTVSGAIYAYGTDDTAAITAAINGLPAGGGEVIIPRSVIVSSTIPLGNGSGASPSTQQGIILRGLANPGEQLVFGYTPTVGSEIFWAGGASPVLQAKIIQGWGVQKLKVNCMLTTGAVGITSTAGVYGDSRDLSIGGCAFGILEQANTSFGSFHNAWRNITVSVPFGSNFGIELTGNGTNAATNTSFSYYENVSIGLTGGTSFGLFLQATDSAQFHNIHIAGGNASSVGVNFDYTATGVSGQWPASTMFFGLEPDEGSVTSFQNGGTPGAGASPNIIYGLEQTNGASVPNLANLSVYGANKMVLSPGANSTNTIYNLTNGHVDIASSGTPTLGVCNGAGSSLSGNDTRGVVQTQTAAATSCTITFAHAYTSNLQCFVQNQSNQVAMAASTSLSALTVNFASATSFFFNYYCIGT